MTGSSISLIIALGGLLLLSAFFSASETAFNSFNRIRMKNKAEEGDPKAERVLRISADYDKLLSTVLIGNNIVNIVSTSLATVLFVGFFGNMGVTISTIAMTLLVLLFGEISPKALAKESPEAFAMFAVPFLRVFMVVLAPLNWVMTNWQKLIHKLVRPKSDRSATEQELLTYVEEVRAEGGINAQEEDMIRSVIEFDDLEAGDIFTPRVDVRAVSMDEDTQKIAAVFHETGYSRLPVYKGTVDSIVGVLLLKDFHYSVQTLQKTVEEAMRPILFIPKGVKVAGLLNDLQRQKIHMAVVVDEHGGTLGIVTIEDIVEELVGEIWDEHDEVREEMLEIEPGRYRVYGGTSLDKLFDLFGLKNHEAASLTVGGWVVEQLGHIPITNESFTGDGLAVTVAEMRRNRVEAVLAQKAPEDAPKGDEATYSKLI